MHRAGAIAAPGVVASPRNRTRQYYDAHFTKPFPPSAGFARMRVSGRVVCAERGRRVTRLARREMERECIAGSRGRWLIPGYLPGPGARYEPAPTVAARGAAPRYALPWPWVGWCLRRRLECFCANARAEGVLGGASVCHGAGRTASRRAACALLCRGGEQAEALETKAV